MAVMPQVLVLSTVRYLRLKVAVMPLVLVLRTEVGNEEPGPKGGSNTPGTWNFDTHRDEKKRDI